MESDMVKRFGNFKLSEREAEVFEINQRDVLKSKADCELSLVGKVFGEKTVNFTGLKQTMMQLWCREGSLKVIELKSKTFQFVFSREDEKNRVLDKRPWTFDNQLLVLHPWKTEIEADEALFQNVQMWIQVWQIPIQWLTTETVWKIGAGFKKCHNVLIPESGSKEGRYAKMLVEVDLTQPLIRGANIRMEGEQRWVTFRYEQLPSFCVYCGRIGHGERSCALKISDLKNSNLSEGQYGEWLRAVDGRTGNKGKGFLKKNLPNEVLVTGKGAMVEKQDSSNRAVPVGLSQEVLGQVPGSGTVEGRAVSRLMTGMVIQDGEDERNDQEKNEGQPMGISKDTLCGLVDEAEAKMDVVMQENQEDMSILKVVEQKELNRLLLGHEGITKVGSWKRKARAKGKENQGLQGDDTASENKLNLNMGKKKFRLVDEGDDRVDSGISWKKARVNDEEMTPSVALVEVASQKWAQINQ